MPDIAGSLSKRKEQAICKSINMNNVKSHLLYFSFLMFISAGIMLNTSCQNKPKTADLALEQCQKLLDKDDFAAATGCYETSANDFPDRAQEIARTGSDGVLNKCFELFDKKKYEQSLICIDPAAVLNAENASFAPDDPRLYFLLADVFVRHKFVMKSHEARVKLFDRAEKAVNLGLELDHDNAAGHWILGEILSEKPDSQKAEAEFRKVIKLSPESNTYWIKLADKQMGSSQNWDAVTSYNQALLKDPENAFVLYELGSLYERLDRIDETVLSYEKLLKIPPEHIDEKLQDEVDEARQSLKMLNLRRGDEKQSKQKVKNEYSMSQ